MDLLNIYSFSCLNENNSKYYRKRTISTNRIQGYMPSVSGNYKFTASLDPNNVYSACTSMNETNPTYKIYFPYDIFYAETLNYTLKSGTRYPKTISLQGINQQWQLFDIDSNITKDFCQPDSINNCEEANSHIIDIPVQLYKGFQITMIGKDSNETTQLCVGAHRN